MLTPAEEQELAILEQDALEQQMPGISAQPSALTPEEEQELALLEHELSPQPPAPSFGQQVMGVIQTVGEGIDKYGGGASTRAAIGSLQEGKGIGDALSAFGKQYAEDPSLAPTGEQIAAKAGVSTTPIGGYAQDISLADVAGFGLEVVADPLSLIPFGAIAKGGTVGAKMAMKGSKAAAKAITPPSVIKAGEVASNISSSAKHNLNKLFKPVVAKDADKFLKIAEKHGIRKELLPESVEFGKLSPISRKARAVSEGPMGATRVEKYEEFTGALGDAIDKKVSSYHPGGAILGNAEAGRVLRDGFEKSKKLFFDQMDHTYNSIVKQVPDMALTPKAVKGIQKTANEIESFAKELLKEGITVSDRSQANELLKAVAALRESGNSTEKAVRSMRSIGRVAYKTTKGGELPSDIANMRKMYKSLNKGFVDTVRENLGGEIADSLLANNKAMSRYFGKTSDVAKILKNPTDEKVFKSLIASGDTRKIQDLKSILDPDTFDAMKSSYLDSLIKRNAEGGIHYTSTLNNIKRMRNKDALNVMFDGDELNDFVELLQLGDRGGIPFLSTSATSASNQFSNIINTVKNFALDEVTLQRAITGARSRTEKAAMTAIKAKDTVKAARKISRLPPTKRKAFLRTLKAMQVKSIGNSEDDQR